MMTLAQIVKVMKCSNGTAMARLQDEKVPFEVRSPAKTGGHVRVYRITPDEVIKLKKQKAKTPEQKAYEHGVALSALESIFVRRQGMGAR